VRENLEQYACLIGIDTDERALRDARDYLGQEDTWFIQMDAEQLGFRNEGLDTVSIGASLHHLSNISQVLTEIERVLKPGGHLILSEMHRDGATAPQRTVVALHHWVADIDTALGLVHNRTLSRQELVDHVVRLGLLKVTCYDWCDTDENPHDEAVIARVEELIDTQLQRARETSSREALEHRGEQLLHKLHEVGMTREPVVVIVAEKKGG
jgi:SAM-dependent methyltransferase